MGNAAGGRGIRPVIPANAGIQSPLPAASPDTRFRGYDNVRENYSSAFFGSPTMNSRVSASTEFNRS